MATLPVTLSYVERHVCCLKPFFLFLTCLGEIQRYDMFTNESESARGLHFQLSFGKRRTSQGYRQSYTL